MALPRVIILLVFLLLLFFSGGSKVLSTFFQALTPLGVATTFIVPVLAFIVLGELFKSFTAFLEPAALPISPKEDNDVKLSTFQKRLERLEDLASTLREHPPLDEDATANLVESLKDSIKSRAHTELIGELREQIGQNLTIAYIEAAVRLTLGRLGADRQTLARRSNINLFVGLLTTAVGIGYLIIAGGNANLELLRQGAEATHKSITFNDYLVAYAPRLSLVIVIEVFAYFFLTLYKTGVADVKYVQNEITTVEMRVLALITAMLSNDSKATTPILQALGTTDRNVSLSAPTTHTQPNSERAKLLEIVKELVSTAKK